MKNFFLKTGLTLLCLIIGLGSAWGEDQVYEMTIDSSNAGGSNVHWTATSQSSLSFGGITWATSVEGTSSITASKIYAQIGTKASPATKVSISTTGFAGKTIKAASLTGFCMSNTGPELTITAGSTPILSNESLIKTNSTTYSTANTISPVTMGANDALTFTITSSAKAAIVISRISITYEGSAPSTNPISSIAVKTSPSKTTYTEGETFDPTGLVITATYSDNNTEDIEYSGNESDFTFEPALTTPLTMSDNSVTITYKSHSVNQPITVEQSQTGGEATVTFDNLGYESWGKGSAFSGNTYDVATQSKSDVTFTYTRNTGSLYANNTSIRFYKDNELTFTAPSGYKITSISWTGSAFKDDVTTDVATCTSTTSALSWSGSSSSVTFTRPSDATSYITLSSVTVKLEANSGNPTITADNTLDITAAEADGTFNVTWTGFGDDMIEVNLYNNEACTVAFNGDWFNVELDDDNNVYYLAGENTNSASRTVYMQLYGLDSEDNEYTHIVTVTQAGKQGDPEITNFIMTSTINLTLGEDTNNYDIRECLNLPDEYKDAVNDTYKVTATIGNLYQSDGDFNCTYPYITFLQAKTYTVHVVAAAIEGKYAETSGDITVNVTETLEEITTIEDLYTFATTVGEKDGEKNEHGAPAKLTFDNWVVTGVKNSGTQTYVADGTKGFIIYGTSAGFEEGDIISGTVNVRVSLYHGAANVEDVKATTDGITVTKNGTVTPVTTTINDLSAINTGSVVSLQNLTWNATDKVFSDGTNTIAYFNGIIPKDDTAPTLENGKKYNITGVYLQWNTITEGVTTAEIGEIMPRTANDVQVAPHTVTIVTPENGTLTVKSGDTIINDGDMVNDMTNLQITVEPNDGYELNYWRADNGTNHDFSTTFAWTVTGDVTISAVFQQIATYTVNWSVNGQIVKTDENVTKTTVLEAPAVTIPTGVTKVFRGWVTTPTVDANEEPDYVKLDKESVSEDITYYAVFAKQEGEGEGEGGDYVLVESALENWTGEYLIVYNNTYAMNTHYGNQNANTYATYTDISSYYDDKTIESNTTTDALVYRAAKTTNGYSLYSVSDKSYLGITKGSTSTGAKLRWNTTYTEEECDWTLGVNSIGNYGSNTLYIRWNNNSGSYRFAVYGKTGQQEIQLFKKSATTGGATYSDFTTLVSCEISISQYGATSFSVPRNYTMPTGITGKTITANKKVDSLGDGYYKLTYSADYEEGSVVPAGESLVLYGEQGNYTIIYEGSPEKTLKVGNLLHGVYEAKDGKFLTTYDKENSGSYYYYKLTTQRGENFGWYYGATEGAPFLMSRDDRAYLVIEKEIAAGIRGFALEDGEEEDLTTGIDNMETNSTNSIYNLQGLQQSKLQKGINIVNGKKVIR